MAINEFSFSIIPSDYNGTNYRSSVWENIPINNDEFTRELTKSVCDQFVFLEKINDLNVYGNPNNLRIYLSTNHGLLSSIVVRINVAQSDIAIGEIQKLVRIFADINVYCWTDNDSKIGLDKDLLMDEIYKSRAMSFVNSPKDFFKDKL